MLDMSKYFTVPKKKGPSHEKAASANLIWEFLGEKEIDNMMGYFKLKTKHDAYVFWLKKVGKCTYGDTISMLKGLETLPLKYNKTAVIINKLKKLNDTNRGVK